MTVFRSLERLNPYGVLSLLFLLIGIATVFLPNEPLKDEQFYFPLIQVFGANYIPSIDLIKTMDQSMGPIYFIFYGFIGQLTDYSIPLLRIVNVVVSFLTAVVLFKILRQFCRYPLCLSLWFVVNPYFLLLTTPLLYTDNLCMLFVLLGMYFYLVKRNLVLSGLLWGLALWTRQTAIIIPLAALITELCLTREKFSSKILTLALTGIPFVAFIFLVILWDFNLTSPSTEHEVNSISTYYFSFKKLTYAILLSGVYSAPMWLPRLREIANSSVFYVAILSTGLLFIDFPRVINEDGYLGVWTAGIFDNFLIWIEGFAFILVPLIWIPSFAFFLLIAISAAGSKTKMFSAIIIFLFFLFQSIFTYSWDKYFILVIPALLIAGSLTTKQPQSAVKSN